MPRLTWEQSAEQLLDIVLANRWYKLRRTTDSDDDARNATTAGDGPLRLRWRNAGANARNDRVTASAGRCWIFPDDAGLARRDAVAASRRSRPAPTRSSISQRRARCRSRFAIRRRRCRSTLLGTLHLLQALAAIRLSRSPALRRNRRSLRIGAGGRIAGRGNAPAAAAQSVCGEQARCRGAVLAVAREPRAWTWSWRGRSTTSARDRAIASPFPILRARSRQSSVDCEPPVIRVGDLDVTRDFTDVRDVDAKRTSRCWNAASPAKSTTYAPGRSTAWRRYCAELIELAGVEVKIETRDASACGPPSNGACAEMRRRSARPPDGARRRRSRVSLRAALQSWEESIANE